ncbi:hypothetical protein [Cribrihabitans neustonicus]|uniref:hypothetical protein n=1 Tax=Cribrihabitans neustonicus TaxID=1429085 RepID=UPI003B59767D
MSAYRDADAALGALDAKLQELNGLVLANGFLAGVLLAQGDALKQMGAEETREMLRAQARAEYGESGRVPDAAVMQVLEGVLGSRPSAEVIPFPARG